MVYESCEECGGKCCKFQVKELHGTLSEDEKKYYNLRGKIISSERDGQLLIIYSPCKNLSVDGKCMDYDNRPEICKGMNENNLNRYCTPIGCKYDIGGIFGEDYGL